MLKCLQRGLNLIADNGFDPEMTWRPGGRVGQHEGLARGRDAAKHYCGARPVQAGTFDGNPCTLRNPMRAKAYASLAPDGMPQSSIVRSRTSGASSYSMPLSVGLEVPPPDATTSGTS